MCWIFAYNWNKNCIDTLVDWLRKLEYRWYDSAWVFWINSNSQIYLEKEIWKVSNLASKVHKNVDNNISYTNWIAHTRWATHWKVTLENTHPHYSENKRFFVVHNWIIENFISLRKKLEKKYTFYSNTDTEVIAKLIEDLFEKDLLTTIKKITDKLIWAYSICVIDINDPDTLVCTKLWSPMIIWINDDCIFISSDMQALNNMTTEFISLDDNETVIIKNWKYHIYSLWEKIIKERQSLDCQYNSSDKWLFETYTEKEIFEIPSMIKNVLKWRIDYESNTITNETLEKLNNYDITHIEIIASWSSYFAWLTWQQWFEQLSNIKTTVRVSSEFLYELFIPNKNTLYIFLSQSWETADVRESVKKVQQKWCLTFWIVNVVGSTIAKMCDLWLYTHSWVEIWVASTKNIISQLMILLLMSISLWLKNNLQSTEAKKIISKLKNIDQEFNSLLDKHSDYKTLAKKYSHFKNFFYLWRNLVFWTASECSLKMKELSYIHSESYSTWELKHWPLALVNKTFPCIVINPKHIVREKTISNIMEIKSRDGLVLWVISKWDDQRDFYDDIIEIPNSHPILTPFLPLIPLWIFAVEIAKELDRDIDKPQNLAKSVTVE